MAEYRKWLFRRDTAAAWTAANPTLLSGEMGIETDTRKFKIGDGTTAWNSLGYSAMVPVDIDSFLEGSPTEDEAHKAPTSEWAFDHAADTTSVHNFDASGNAPPQDHASNHAVSGSDTVFPADPGADKYLKWNDTGSAIEWADVTGATPAAHKDTHDPEDGSDALDADVAAEIASVQAAAEGSSHSFARADHVHAINHAITDNHIVTIDGADIADDEYARFTANGLESRTAAEVITDLLSASLPENTSIILDTALSADGKYSGTMGSFTAGENLVYGEVAYLKAADSKMWKTDADAESTTKPFIAMALGTINADAAGNFMLVGFVREDDWNWTVGSPLFIGATTAGGLTATAPSTTGQFVRCIGQAISADEIWFNPDNAWIKVA